MLKAGRPYGNCTPASGAAPRAKYPVSIKGGSEARWRRDGKELYYVALFDTTMPFPRNDGNQSQRCYDVTADGQRFLINTPRVTTNPSPITVVLNWTDGLKR